MRTRRSWRNQDRLWKAIGADLARAAHRSAALVFYEPGSDEWAEAWAGLAGLGYKVPAQGATPDGAVCPACCQGECWQYMGTTTVGTRLVHQFRHRAYPAPDGPRRVHVEVPGSLVHVRRGLEC